MVVTAGALLGRSAADWAGPLAAVVVTTAAVVWQDAGPATPVRHLYLVPVVWAALRFGLGGGLGTAAVAILLAAPFLLGAIETWGLDQNAVEGFVTLGLLPVVGGLAGSLADRARRQLERYETALALQRSLGSGRPLAEGLGLVNDALRRLFGAEEVEVVVVLEDGRWVGARGPRPLAPGSTGAWVAEHRRARYLRDAPGAAVPGRPRRAAVVPLAAGGAVVGVAGAGRAAGFSRDDRAALSALGVQIALALENARLEAELESKVAAAARRLGELDRAKSELVSIASHELRTPLTSLRGYSELLLTRQYGPDESRRFLTVIHSEAERLGRMLDNLLDLARIERGQSQELDPVPVAARPLLEAQVESFQAQGVARGFRVLAADELPPLLVDRDAVDRILTNLLSNAVKYSPAGSEIRLVATPRPGGFADIAVEDDGVGIPQDALPLVFDRYYRVTRPGGVRGLGLGLALVKSLVESNGGAIRVESTLGVGSRFTVTLPCAPAPPREPAADG